MPQTFLFIRHGSIPIQGDCTERLPPLKVRPLSPQGEEEAQAAGAFIRGWLGERTVERLVLAGSTRSRQTADIIFRPLPPTTTQPMRRGDPRAWLEAAFEGLGPDAVVVRSGHGPGFLAMLGALAPGAPDRSLAFGAVAIYTGRPWRLVALHPA